MMGISPIHELPGAAMTELTLEHRVVADDPSTPGCIAEFITIGNPGELDIESSAQQARELRHYPIEELSCLVARTRALPPMLVEHQGCDLCNSRWRVFDLILVGELALAAGRDVDAVQPHLQGGRLFFGYRGDCPPGAAEIEGGEARFGVQGTDFRSKGPRAYDCEEIPDREPIEIVEPFASPCFEL